MEKIIDSNLDFKNFVNENSACVVYFSTPTCSVCKVLKPKIQDLLYDQFPLMKLGYVNVHESKELAAQNQVLSVPTILFYFNGKEFFRRSRNINLHEVIEHLQRPYNLLFEVS